MTILSWLIKIKHIFLISLKLIGVKAAISFSISLAHSFPPFKQDGFFPYRCIRNDSISPKPYKLTVCPLDTIAWPALCSSSPIMCD